MAAALQQVAPAVIVAGQGAPGQQDAQVQADSLALINGQQARIRDLERRVLQGQLQGAQDAQAYENRLFAVSQERQALLDRVALLERQVEANDLLRKQKEDEVEALKARQVRDAEQIAIGLREIALLAAQVQQEREQVQLLRGQLEIAAGQIQQLTVQVQQLGQMHRETLAAMRQQPTQQTTLIEGVASWAWGLLWKGIRGHPVSDYTKM